MSDSQTAAWQSQFAEERTGAGYFLAKKGRLCFEPAAYIRFRGLNEQDSARLVQEWQHWIRDLKKCTVPHVREAAVAAKPLTRELLDHYYVNRVIVERHKVVLKNSSKQLGDADEEISSYLQKLREQQQSHSGLSTSASSFVHQKHVKSSIPTVSSLDGNGQTTDQSALAGSDLRTSTNPKPSTVQHKRKASVTVYPLGLKEPSFPPPVSPHGSKLHAAFDSYKDRSKTLAESGLDFATHKGEALALNGIWFVGNVDLECPEAKEIQQAMREDYRVPEFLDIMALTSSIGDILQDGSDQQITEKIDSLSAASDLPWRARRALKVWRQLGDMLPAVSRRDIQDGEQTFIGRVLQPFLSVTFSERGPLKLKGDIEHASSNADKDNHQKGVRSDFFVETDVLGSTLHFVGLIGEVKPPEKTSPQLELEDQWKLFRMMKSEVDAQVNKGISNPVVWGCQVFGYDITFYVMDRRVALLNCLWKVFVGTLPKSVEDVSGISRIMSAFFHIESRINAQRQALKGFAGDAPPVDPQLHSQPNQMSPRKKKAKPAPLNSQ